MITDCSYTKMADTSNSSSLGEDYTTLSNAESPTDAFQESSANEFFQPDSMENKTLANVTKGSESWRKPLFGYYQRIVPQMPLVGYSGPMFYAINYSAFICIVLSFVVNSAVLLHMFVFDQRRRFENGGSVMSSSATSTYVKQSRASFWSRTRGERLVAYLAIADLCYSIVHSMDKGYYAFMVQNPPDLFCAVIGAFKTTFVIAQWFVVLFTSISSFSLVVFGKSVKHGRYDWRLLVAVFGVPMVNSIILFFLGLTGQSGTWSVYRIPSPDCI